VTEHLKKNIFKKHTHINVINLKNNEKEKDMLYNFATGNLFKGTIP